MEIQQEFVTELPGGLRLGKCVAEVGRQTAADGFDENPQPDPVVTVVPENLQTGQGVGAILENRSVILRLF